MPHTRWPRPGTGCLPRRLAVVLARLIAFVGLGRIEPLTWQVARMWMPVNLIFVAMLATNFYALKIVVSQQADGQADGQKLAWQ